MDCAGAIDAMTKTSIAADEQRTSFIGTSLGAALLLLGWSLCLSSVEAATAGKTLNEATAVRMLVRSLQRAGIYRGRVRFRCLQYVTEKQSPHYFLIAVREKHGDGCPGDSDTWPLVDRFKVLRRARTILWYDPLQESARAWLPFSVLKTRRRQW